MKIQNTNHSLIYGTYNSIRLFTFAEGTQSYAYYEMSKDLGKRIKTVTINAHVP